jgi:MFS family permease
MTEHPDTAAPSGSTHDAPDRRGIFLATWGLFVGLALILGAGGLFSTLQGVRAELDDLPTIVSAGLSTAYYAGFLIGSRFALRAIGQVGHIRVFATLGSLLAAVIVFVGLTDSPSAWIALRVVTGVCFAGLYVVAESWLNGIASNAFRGRLLSTYSAIVIGAFGAGQLLVAGFDARSATGFAVAGAITSLAVMPVAMSAQAAVPHVEEHSSLSMRELARAVPTGAGAMLLVGFAHGSTIGLAATHATREGLGIGRTGLLVACLQLGGMLSNWPINAASDDIDRRIVAVVIAIGTIAMALLFMRVDITSSWALLVMLGLGAMSSPLYAMCSAYTNDWIEAEHLNAAASQLVMLYGIGAMVGPLIASQFMDVLGATGYPWAVVTMHAAITLFLVYRIRAWHAPLTNRPWSEVGLPARAFFVPATIVALGTRRRRRS